MTHPKRAVQSSCSLNSVDSLSVHEVLMFLQTLGYKVLGRTGLVVIPILVAVSTFGTANITLLMGSR